MNIRLQVYSFRYAEQVFNSKLELKLELEKIVKDAMKDVTHISRKSINQALKDQFIDKGWQNQPQIFDNETPAYARFDFYKNRVGVEVQMGHASFIGIDLLKFQIASYSNLDKIDLGVYITTTKNLQKYAIQKDNEKWDSSLTFEKVENYLPHVKSAIQVPIYVIGIDI